MIHASWSPSIAWRCANSTCHCTRNSLLTTADMLHITVHTENNQHFIRMHALKSKSRCSHTQPVAHVRQCTPPVHCIYLDMEMLSIHFNYIPTAICQSSLCGCYDKHLARKCMPSNKHNQDSGKSIHADSTIRAESTNSTLLKSRNTA